jgi:hypothetical protein
VVWRAAVGKWDADRMLWAARLDRQQQQQQQLLLPITVLNGALGQHCHSVVPSCTGSPVLHGLLGVLMRVCAFCALLHGASLHGCCSGWSASAALLLAVLAYGASSCFYILLG